MSNAGHYTLYIRMQFSAGEFSGVNNNKYYLKTIIIINKISKDKTQQYPALEKNQDREKSMYVSFSQQIF